jgi:crotonobetainyl-CoA:carnitine CoA-transferase CaiB-like acyl-CoA transferase
VTLNRNKRSLTLNLKTEPGRRVFEDLVQNADVVIESFRPGVMEGLGLGYQTLKGHNDAIIYCAITGYGQDGPRSQTAGHDVNYIGYAGLLSITGTDDGRPVIPGVQIGDLAGGAMSAVIAVLAALYDKNASGKGRFLDVSMMDGAVSWLSMHASQFFATKEVPQPGQMPLSGAYPCYRLYPAADGWLTVGALEPHFWSALCDAIGRPDLLGDAYSTGARRVEVIEQLDRLFSTRTRAEWMQHFGDRDVCVAPVNDLSETFADPQLIHRGMLVDQPIPGADLAAHVGNPLSRCFPTERLIERPPPDLGEHTLEILEEIGVSEGAAEDLRAAGAI